MQNKYKNQSYSNVNNVQSKYNEKYIVHIIIIIYTYKNSLQKNHLRPIQWKLQVVVKRIKIFN